MSNKNIWIVAKQKELVDAVKAALQAPGREFRLLGSEVETRVELGKLRLIKNNPNLPDVIIAENDMSRNDAGLDVARFANSGTDKVPTIIMSARSASIDDAMKAGAIDFHDRNEGYNVLRAKVDTALSQSRSGGRNP